MSKIGRHFKKLLHIRELDPNLCNAPAEFTLVMTEAAGQRHVMLCRQCALICYTTGKILGLRGYAFLKHQELRKERTCQGFKVREMGIAPDPAPGTPREVPLPSQQMPG